MHRRCGEENVNIGTGVTAYNKEDGTTLLMVVNNDIDMTSQSMATLSCNQMRHRGVDNRLRLRKTPLLIL